MAAPVFLSSRWNANGPKDEVVRLDRALRLRGVPVWRDVRQLRAGGQNEAAARQAIANQACGFVLYLSEDIFDSWFIDSVELAAVRERLRRDESFFVAAVYADGDTRLAERLAEVTGVDVQAFQGCLIGGDPAGDLDHFAAQLLRHYLETVSVDQGELLVETRDEIGLSSPAPVHLNWREPFSKPSQEGAGAPGDDLADALADVRGAFEQRRVGRQLLVSGRLHLSAAFLVGWEFREPTGWSIEAAHPRLPARTEAVAPDQQGWTMPLQTHQADSSEMVLQIAAAQDVAAAVRRHRQGRVPRVDLTVLPPEGVGKSSLDDVDLNALAAAVVTQVQRARTEQEIEQVELYMACPWTLSLVLGWHFASLGSVAVYEATDDKGTYHDKPLELARRNT